MANMLQQLDLFGMPVEQPAPPKVKKEKVARPSVIRPKPEQIMVEEEPEAVGPAVTPVAIPAPSAVAVSMPPAQPEPAIEAAPAPEIEASPVSINQTRATAITSSPAAVATNTVRVKGKRGRKSFKEIDNEVDLVEIPEDEVLKQKLYYTISEVAGWFKVNTSLLRYWENEFDILQPRKTRKGDRLFRVEDIRNLQLIYFLLRQRKFSIDGAKNYLRNNRKEADTQVKLMETLTRFRSFLVELKTNL